MSAKSVRSKRGLLICALKSDEGVMRITMDDVVRKDDDGIHWDKASFVTAKDYDERLFDKLKFDEKELADFGYYILSRLHAFKKRGEL